MASETVTAMSHHPRSLTFQAACIRDVLDAARSEEIRAGLEGALSTILWLEKQAELLRMWTQLRMSRPELFAALHAIATTFPGAQIVRMSEGEDLS